MRETIAMREIIANAEGVREVKAKCVSLLQNAGNLANMNLETRISVLKKLVRKF